MAEIIATIKTMLHLLEFVASRPAGFCALIYILELNSHCITNDGFSTRQNSCDTHSNVSKKTRASSARSKNYFQHISYYRHFVYV